MSLRTVVIATGAVTTLAGSPSHRQRPMTVPATLAHYNTCPAYPDNSHVACPVDHFAPEL